MRPRPRTCIVCGGRADSGEHIFPACAGGLRENNKIYCGDHNEAYGPLAKELGEQLCFFNAQFLIKNTRKKHVRPVDLEGDDGVIYEFDGTTLRVRGVQSLQSEGETTAYVTSDPAEARQKIAELKAQGYTVGQSEQRAFHPGRLGKQLKFGGPAGLRAIGYIAQTFFAHCFPEHARNVAMAPFIDYTLNGNGSDFVWWDFEAPAEDANHYALGHRITVGVDAEARHAYARVSLYSTLDFAMIFYEFPPSEDLSSQAVCNDIDPAAEKMPNDLRQRREAHVVSPVSRPSDTITSLRVGIESGEAERRHNKLMQRASRFREDHELEALSSKLAGASHRGEKEDVIRDYWASETQRILRLLELGLATLRQQPGGDPRKDLLVKALEDATHREGGAPSGLSASAESAIAIAGRALTDAMLKDLAADRLDDARIRKFINSGHGADVAVRAVLIDRGLLHPAQSLRNFLLASTSLTRLNTPRSP